MQKLVEIGIDGTAKQKERARDAEALQGQIFNTRFTLRLSFLTDVYNVNWQCQLLASCELFTI